MTANHKTLIRFRNRRKDRIATLTPEREVNDDQVDSIIMLKKSIIDRMAQLDPHPFWAEQKDYLVAHEILNKEAEYTIGTLEKNLEKLTTEGKGRGSDSFFFQKRTSTADFINQKPHDSLSRHYK